MTTTNLPFNSFRSSLVHFPYFIQSIQVTRLKITRLKIARSPQVTRSFVTHSLQLSSPELCCPYRSRISSFATRRYTSVAFWEYLRTFPLRNRALKMNEEDQFRFVWIDCEVSYIPFCFFSVFLFIFLSCVLFCMSLLYSPYSCSDLLPASSLHPVLLRLGSKPPLFQGCCRTL